jgi:outer membrane protein assembly factor BamE (lipoprotein component of BamABCDE complex)
MKTKSVMNRLITHSIILITFVTIGACASVGRNFVRPNNTSLILMKTTKEELLKQLGDPESKENILSNGESVEKVRYVYVHTRGNAIFPDVIPAKGLTLNFWRGKLVGYLFTSSFKEDNTHFDSDSASTIQKGQSLDEVIRNLGHPNGQKVYPLILEKEKRAYKYSYVQSRRGYKGVYRQILEIVTDSSGKISSVSYDSSDMN